MADWHTQNNVDLQGSLHLISDEGAALWLEMSADLDVIGGAHRVLVANDLRDRVRSRLRRKRPPQAHLSGVLRSSPALTFIEARAVEFYDHHLPGRAGVSLQGHFQLESGGPRVYADQLGRRVERIVLWGWVETDHQELGGRHRVLIAGDSQVDRVGDAIRRWARVEQHGTLRAQVRGVLHSGQEGVFVEARYVEFFGLPE
jgi:hypothetical protein